MITERVRVDPITLAVIHNRTLSVVREMEAVTYLAARSPVVFSGRDFSCAVLDAQGQLLACVTGIALHILPMLFQARRVLERYREDFAEGDIVLGNDPWEGNIHLNDVAMFQPVLDDGDLVALVCIRMHWPDIGGMVPGSLSGNAREVYQEGLRIPIMRVGRGYEFDPDILELIMRNVRMPGERSGDLRASVSGCNAAVLRLKQLIARYGRATTVTAWDRILEQAEERMRAAIRALPDTTVVHEGYMDNDGTSQEQIRIRAAVTVTDDNVVVDFTGSSPQARGPMNVTLGPAHCFAFMAIKAALDPKGPINSGAMRPVQVVAPEGTILNARPPAAAAGSGEIRYACNVALMALSQLVPDRVSADDGSSTVHHPLYLRDPDDGPDLSIVHYDMVGGGGGARADRDGLDFVRNIGSGNAVTPSVEVLEQRYPILFTRHSLRPDSGGPGKYRGGLGIVRERKLLSDGLLSMLGDHAIFPLAGLDSGFPGALSRWEIISNGVARPASPDYGNKVSAVPLAAGDLFRSATTGGSGWGDPLQRDPSAVLADVLDGKVSLEQAREAYGVVIDPIRESIDSDATAKQRASLAHEIVLYVRPGGQAIFDSGVRVGWVGSSWSAYLEPKRWRLAEVFRAGMRNPLRLRMHMSEDLPANVLVLDEQACADLRVHEGEALTWRTIGE